MNRRIREKKVKQNARPTIDPQTAFNVLCQHLYDNMDYMDTLFFISRRFMTSEFKMTRYHNHDTENEIIMMRCNVGEGK